MNDHPSPLLDRRRFLAGLGAAAAALALDPPARAAARRLAPTICEPTTPDLKGPFWAPNAPSVTHLVRGGGLRITGEVRGPDCRPIAGASVHVWQADGSGRYHEDQLRGVLRTAADGSYAFDTLRPGHYREPDGWRPAHIHYEVVAPGHRPLVTQLYFAGDPYLSPNDSCDVCRSDGADRIISLTPFGRGARRVKGHFVITLGPG